MFFRRERAPLLSFDDRLGQAQSAGFQVARKGGGKAVAMRERCAAVLEDGETVKLSTVGVVVGNEIGELTDAGYMKYWTTPTGKKEPATAEQLKQLHAFTEDLRESMGLTSLYNEGLGTVNEKHLYDRVEGRDAGHHKPYWQN